MESSQILGMVELEIWCAVSRKSVFFRHNLSAEADTLSRSVYEPIAIPVLRADCPPIWEKGVELGSSVVPYESHRIRHNLYVEIRYLAPFKS